MQNALTFNRDRRFVCCRSLAAVRPVGEQLFGLLERLFVLLRLEMIEHAAADAGRILVFAWERA